MADVDPVIMTGDREAAETLSPQPATPEKRRWGRIILMLSLPLALAVGAAWYWMGLQGKISTDNAYIQQDRVAISAEVGGRIVEVLVKDGDTVEAGQLLFRLDEMPYKVQIAEADAMIAQAQVNRTALGFDADLSGAAISAAQEEIAFAQANFARKDALYKRGFLTRTEHDAGRHAIAQAQEELRMAQARRAEAQAKLAQGAAVPGKDPRIAAGEAQRASATLNLDRTKILSPTTGIVTQAERLQVGQQVVQGLPVLTVVEDGSTYVEANFKETDLNDMAIGQRAEVRVDAYPGLVLKGRVQTIGAGTGSEFSVLPAQNATGNWVKVTQRVPVRIKIEERSPRRLIAGLSTEITVFTAEN